MANPGFVHDLLDIKVLLLFIMARVKYPTSGQQVREMCFELDPTNYFDASVTLYKLCDSGHLEEVEPGVFQITEKGRNDGALTEDSLLYSVRHKMEGIINRFNHQLRRSAFVSTDVVPADNGESAVVMSLNDETGKLISMELSAPNRRQGMKIARRFEERAEIIYNMVMAELLEEEEENDG